MMQQAEDFLDECEALYQLIADLDDQALQRPTGFKQWTIDDIVGHLHTWNYAADLSLTDSEGFSAFYAQVKPFSKQSRLRDFEDNWLTTNGVQRVQQWREYYLPMAQRFGAADPSQRVEWAGPGMSVRSSITARLMETWAHAQAVYDELGVVRDNTDRIKNIVVLGNNTYGWTFAVNSLAAPEPVPHLVLTSPSGAIWTFNEPSDKERIEGLAEHFCQVVTQTRNIADTTLAVSGDNAVQWMQIAQCFAGGPQTPPARGTRVINHDERNES